VLNFFTVCRRPMFLKFFTIWFLCVNSSTNQHAAALNMARNLRYRLYLTSLLNFFTISQFFTWLFHLFYASNSCFICFYASNSCFICFYAPNSCFICFYASNRTNLHAAALTVARNLTSNTIYIQQNRLWLKSSFTNQYRTILRPAAQIFMQQR